MLRKKNIKAILYAALVNKGILPKLQGTPEQSGQSVKEAVRLILQKEKELHYMHTLETSKLEQQTKICLLELERGSLFLTS